MNRTDRLVALVMLLQSRRVVTAAEMAEHFEVTERTVYRDLAALGEGGVPIVGEPGVGYSLMRGYQLPPVMFSPEETFALVTGGLLAERMTDGSVRDAMRSALVKLTAVLPADLKDRVERLQSAMEISGRKTVAGAVPLSKVQSALAERRVLRLEYRGAARGEATVREIEPLGLAHYLDNWHLIAWCRLRKEVRDFRVDRIAACELLGEKLPARKAFDLAEYLDDWFGSAAVEIAELDLHPRYVDSARRFWGPALRDEKPNGEWVRVELACESIKHLAPWLLGLGRHAKVVSPKTLREEIATLAREAIEHHSKKIDPAKTLLT
jgi:predicted DNA-binding transcriptional regulator YafY